jgi:hypothetical protein
MANLQFFNLKSDGSGGGVTEVTATPPITSTGGDTPIISTSMNTNRLIGRSSAGVGVMEEIEVGDGLTLSGGILTNTATPAPLGYYGAFYDTTSQIASSSGGYPNPNQNNSAPLAMTFNSTDFSNGVSIQSQSQITIANTGIYNIQFSAQLYNTGGNPEKVWIWLRKNGVDLNDTNTFLPIGASTNNEQNVASWNFLVDAIGGDYFQIMWASSQWNRVELYYQPASSDPPKPEIPSIILTVTQQSGIMAGTGITALNGLTADVQTFATGTTGTDFNISSSGSTHTFNIPTASNLARGLVSILAQTFAGIKTFLSAPIFDSLTASQILATDGSKAVQSLDTATYPSLTELSYVKGVTSAIQTQINSKISVSTQIWGFQLANVIAASTTTWVGVGVTAGSNETTSTFIIPVACTLSDMYTQHYSTAQPATGSQVITVRKNGVDTALAITIVAGSAPTTTPYSDLVDSVSFAVGDKLAIRRVNNAATTGGAVNGLTFKMVI